MIKYTDPTLDKNKYVALMIGKATFYCSKCRKHFIYRYKLLTNRNKSFKIEDTFECTNCGHKFKHSIPCKT